MTIAREDPRFWDIRTVERRIRKGLLTTKDFEKHLKSLEDAGDRVAPPPSDASDDAAED